MQLTSLAFTELAGQINEWQLERFALSKANLLVGKNATGKTRTINVINFLSTLLTGHQKDVFSSASYDVVFEDSAKRWVYSLAFENSVITKEMLHYNGENVLHRGMGSFGHILAEDIDGKRAQIRFSVPGSQVAVFAKRDDAQHSFLGPLHEWGASVRLFRLGWEVNPLNLTIAVKPPVHIPVNEKETSNLVAIFKKAQQELGGRYEQAIIADMRELGYDLESVDIRRANNVVTNIILPGEFVGVAVKEKDLQCVVDQNAISHGMFRALSLVAQVNYYVLAKKDACILADDVGEGLDFERSCALVDVLRHKSQGADASLQLVMSTNNRFVMNRVPLEEWCLLQRKGHRVQARNYRNAEAAFERFKATGLNNFDLLRTDFLEKTLAHG